VVNYPYLAETVDAEQDLVQIRVVVYGVDVIPVRSRVPGVVEVYQFRVLGYGTVVFPGFIVVPDEVIPGVPLPHNLAPGSTRGLNFDNMIRP
jgi:hypothetical protein